MFADLNLSQRLEHAEGLAGSTFAEARARNRPASGACWTEIAGARCIFDGASSPATQTFGLGLFEPVTPEALDRIEAFFKERNAPVFHEVSPLADPSALELLNEHGYKPFEFTSILVQELHPDPPEPSLICPVRPVGEDEANHWAALSARGWNQGLDLAGMFEDMAAMQSELFGTVALYAEVDGQPAATGALSIQGDIALFAGASTVPEARGRGAQQSLLKYRLYYAARHGCSVAMMAAWPGTASQRNAERSGFQVAYTRLKWKL